MDGAVLLSKLGQVASARGPATGLPSGIVRFVLEFQAEPDVSRERERLAALLGTQAFTLKPFATSGTSPFPSLARFLVLQLESVQRTQSSTALFEMGNTLADWLELVSCEPDVGARLFYEPSLPGDPGRVESAIVDLWCRSDAPAPSNVRWTVEALRLEGAWKTGPRKGAGVLIAQPDTGIAAHVEIEEGALALDKAANLIEGGAEPVDPLEESMSNPGHGTATASVVVSRSAGQIVGAAPGARLAPIRCINDVKIFDGSPVAAAVAHAHAVRADIVTMSLGGIFSRSLRAAIEAAVADGVIVLAAAGNCVGFVVYPASDPNVIAVAGVDQKDKPWVGSSSGASVAIAAPAENVYVARRSPGDHGEAEVSGGQGTSFAVALTAGVAALWLSAHGRDAVQAAAKAHGVTVQELFRAALQQSARHPAGWSTRYGAGVVDADALLKIKLDDVRPSVAVAKRPGALETVVRSAVAGEIDDGFDWRRHGAEASLLSAKAQINRVRAAHQIETIGGGVLRPSRAMGLFAPARVRNLLERKPARPLTVSGGARGDVERLVRIAGAQGGVESAGALSAKDARQRLRTRGKQILSDMETRLAGAVSSNEAGALLASAESAIAKVSSDELWPLSADERVGLEALVMLHGRPALRVRGGEVSIDDPQIGNWAPLLAGNPTLKPALESVGRVDLDGQHAGSGFVVAPGILMTNRHVLEVLAEEFRGGADSSVWEFSGRPSVNFDDLGRGTAKRFAITDVIFAGPDRIDDTVDFRHLDVALLAVETRNAVGQDLPKPLTWLDDVGLLTKGTQIIVAGYPARPGTDSLRDPATGAVRRDVIKRLQEMFGFDYSTKYLSPGEIDFEPGKLTGDDEAWAIAHDATTLGGSSGSWVMHLGEPFGVLGLHFGGGTLRANFAHALSRIAPRLPKLPN